jgi:hypothetical protein
VEFAYKNGYQSSLKMSPFAGRKCNTLVSWNNPIERAIIGPVLLKEMEKKMKKVRQNLKAT